MTRRCDAPLEVESLAAYQRGELPPAEEDRMEEHLLACDACARRLEALDRLRKGVVALVRCGRVRGTVTAAFVARAERDGVRVREYRVDEGAEVPCTAAPEDDLVVVRLAGGFFGPDVLDVTIEATDLATGARRSDRVADVVIDRGTGDIVFLFPGDLVRAVPRTALRYDVHRGGHQDVLASFRLDHTPWGERPRAG
jgi:anti-sigma factor RsiW